MTKPTGANYWAHAFEDYSRGGAFTFVLCRLLDGKTYHLEQNWVEHEEGATFSDDAYLPDGREIVQTIVDAGFKAGVVPRQLEDQRSELRAVKDHLSDMKRLTFSLLEVPE